MLKFRSDSKLNKKTKSLRNVSHVPFACNLSVLHDVLTLYLVLLCINHTTESEFHSQVLDSSILAIGLQLGTVIALIHKYK